MATTIESRKEQAIHVHAGSNRSRGRAAVIGSGFGGLAAAIRLQSMGFETVCFEGRDKAGGRAYVYNDAGLLLMQVQQSSRHLIASKSFLKPLDSR